MDNQKDNISPERQVLLHNLAHQAASWWREQVAKKASPSQFDNGDSSPTGGMTMLLATSLALSIPTPSVEALDKFTELLGIRILAWLLEDPTPKSERRQILGTDYHPDGYLAGPAEQAGINGSLFPWKTLLAVHWHQHDENCYIKVKKGYGAGFVQLPSPNSATPA